VKDVFAKKFLVPGEIPLAARSHRFFGTLAARGQQPDQIRPRAQQGERVRVRRIGVLMASAGDDSENQARMAAFLQGFAQLGWTDGRNLRIDTRWATTNADDLRRHAAELAALAPDVLVAATGTATVAPLLQATRTLPIVFVVVIDPVGAGFVASLARPGGNTTGFASLDYGTLLKEIAPQLKRVAVLREPDIASGIGQLAVIQAAAPSFGVEVRPVVSPSPRPTRSPAPLSA
jgi:putative ABC transport system substrate-binding protein